MKKKTSPPDWLLLFLTVIMVVFGWMMLYSASAVMAETRFGNQYFYLKKQIMWSVIGFACLAGAFHINFKFLQKSSRVFFAGVLILLVLVLLVGHEVGGAKRWLRFGGIGFQPSELAKLATVLMMADYLDRKRSRLDSFRRGFLPVMLMTGTVVGLILLERDLGTPLLIGVVSLGMVFLAGGRSLHLFYVALLSVPALYFAVFSVPYRRARLFSFLNPWDDPHGTGYQLVQSFLALGSGGFWGRGSGESMIKLHYLPESQTDFIFSILGEEFGFLGTAVVTAVFFVIAFRCFQTSLKATQWFDALVAAGVSFWISAQVLVNLGVVTGLFPTKGMPLPFISFGGSSLVVLLIGVGLVLNVSKRSGKRLKERSKRKQPYY